MVTSIFFTVGLYFSSGYFFRSADKRNRMKRIIPTREGNQIAFFVSAIFFIIALMIATSGVPMLTNIVLLFLCSATMYYFFQCGTKSKQVSRIILNREGNRIGFWISLVFTLIALGCLLFTLDEGVSKLTEKVKDLFGGKANGLLTVH